MLVESTLKISKVVAMKMLDILEEKALQDGQVVGMSIVDSAGLFAYYRRMDGASLELVQEAGSHAVRMAGVSCNRYRYGKSSVKNNQTVLSQAIISPEGSVIGALSICGLSVGQAQEYAHATSALVKRTVF